MKTQQERIQKELKSLTRDGLILPHDVVEAARSPKSAMHDMFTWDDNEAAHQYRLYQARQILRTYVVIEDAAPKQVIRAFVSLKPDRQREGGGYRHIADVLSDEQLYQQMLKDSLVELRSLQTKYQRIRELKPIFEATDLIERQMAQTGEGTLAA